MPDSLKKRRRWPYAVLALLLLCGPFAWHYRPLNATERRVVGNWVCAEIPYTPWTFRPDRTFHWLHASGQSVGGTWSCTSTSIEIVHNGPKTRSLWGRFEERARSIWNGWDRHTIDFTRDGHLLISSLKYIRAPGRDLPDPVAAASEGSDASRALEDR